MTDETAKCSYCGKPGEHRYHSGHRECDACWTWRKLDSNAARYYYKLSLAFLSAVDIHDLNSFFPKQVGMTEDDIRDLNRILKMLFEKTEEMAKTHGLEDHWRKGAQEIFEKL